jgi:hypothetical protein
VIDIEPFRLDKTEPTPEQCRKAADDVRAAVDLLNTSEREARRLGLDINMKRGTGYMPSWVVDIYQKI